MTRGARPFVSTRLSRYIPPLVAVRGGELLDSAYRKRLGVDLPRWRDQGWVTSENAAAIMASVEGRRSMLGLSAIVAVMGAVLLGLGVLAFVAANWEQMPRIGRFLLLVAAMAAAYATAGVLRGRSLPALADAALLLAGLIFAAAIALVGQSYHLAGEFADAVLLWLLGCFAAALLTGSATTTVLILAGTCYWSWVSTIDNGIAPHWPGLVLILAGMALATWRDQRSGRTMSVLSLAFWIGLTIAAAIERFEWSIAGGLGLATAAGLLFWSAGSALAVWQARPRIAALGYDLLWPSLAGVLGGLGWLQVTVFWSDTATSRGWLPPAIACVAVAVLLGGVARRLRGASGFDLTALAILGPAAVAFAALDPPDDVASRLLGGVLVLGASLWSISLGQTGIRPIGKKTGLALFGLEVFYLYAVTLGTVLDTALAFLVGGLLFIGLSFLLVRVDRRLAARAAA